MTTSLDGTIGALFESLKTFAAQADFWEHLSLSFGDGFDHTQAAALREQWQGMTDLNLPTIELTDSTSAEGFSGSSLPSTNTITLNRSFVEGASPSEILAAVLRQYGSLVQEQINPDSGLGDGGAAFAAAVQEAGSTLLSSTGSFDSVFSTEIPHATFCQCSSCAIPVVDPDRLKDGATDVAAAATPIDLTQTFLLNSLPGANHTIYLDFNGHRTSGTSWNSQFTGGTDIVTPAFDFDGNTSSFSTAEQERIQYIWQRVAEDFIPFNVNVTTQAPSSSDLIKTSSSDTKWGIRVVIGGDNSWYGAAGGVAYPRSFRGCLET
ncbi:MAG: hypothetical protein VKJ85_00100 [Prochlorothrix sp.]|nr:hypothetical protein [Prochlorothrix sp.]